jgi:hypothetical protein
MGTRALRILTPAVLLLIAAIVSARPAAPAGATPPHKAGRAPARHVPAADPVPARVEFLRDVAPILDRSGCSVAACHGKFGGRAGLQLSLLTLSPEDDYDPLIHAERGRRVNFADPENSLLLLKASGEIPHAGGMRFEKGSTPYRTILRWLKQGAPFRSTDPRVVSFTLSPNKVALKQTGQTVKLRAVATYTDGSTRDVTGQTVFSSTNDSVIAVSQDGVVTGGRWGGGAIMGRYLGTISASFFTLPQARKGAYPRTAENNLIDRYIFQNLKLLNVVPSDLSGDPEFLRRVTLDTIGRLPSLEEIRAFIANSAPDKRTKLIDALLERPEFADFRAFRLAELLRDNPQKLGNGANLADRAADLFYEWILNSVTRNEPWDQFVRELLMARGSIFQNGPACFYRVETEPNDRMENLGQAFLGVRMACARCHKHPFDRWNTDDYWNFSAFMGKVQLAGGSLYDESRVVYNGGAQVINQSVTGKNRGKVAPATFLGEKEPAKAQPDMIAALADWVTGPKNPFFARATINRLWSYYFGRGIVEPVDDMRSTTPESVPGLLDALAQELIRDKYDVKAIIRLILNSRTYQLTSVPNATNVADIGFFSHFSPRPMPAQVLVDMLNQSTGAQEAFGSFPDRSNALQAALPVGNFFLDAFGRSHREFLADIDPKLEPTLVQTLHMINSPYIDNKIRGGAAVPAVVKLTQSDGDLVKELYLRTFCRPPAPAEAAKAVQILKTAKSRAEGAQDLMWALITSREFYFNH